MSSQRPPTALPPLPVEEDAVDNIVSMLLEHAGGHAAAAAQATLRRLAPLSVSPETPLQHVARPQPQPQPQPQAQAQAQPQPQPQPTRTPAAAAAAAAPTLTPTTLLGPSVAEIVAQTKASAAARRNGAAYTPPPTSASSVAATALLRPATEGSVPESASLVDMLVAQARLDTATGDNLEGAEMDADMTGAEAVPVEARMPEPEGHLQMKGAFRRYSERPPEDHPLLKHDANFSSLHDLAEVVLTTCPKVDRSHAEWYRYPAVVEGFDCEVLHGETAAEMYEQNRAPTQEEFEHAWNVYWNVDMPAYNAETDAFMRVWRSSEATLFKLTDAKLAAKAATEEQVRTNSAELESAAGTPEGARMLQRHAAAVATLEAEDKAAEVALRSYVVKHYDAIAEIGRGAPAEPVRPPAKLSEMALRRVPPTHSYRTRYVGLRAQLREFVTALREVATNDPVDEEDGLLKDWMPATTYRELREAVAEGMDALKDGDAWMLEEDTKRDAADGAIVRAEGLAAMAREEDAIAYERIDALVDYVLAKHFEYTGDAPGATPPFSNATAPTWRSVHAFMEQRLLPFLTRLVVGTKALSQARGAAGATGAGTFAQWANDDEPPTFAADVRGFKAYLEDTKHVPVPQETHIGGSDRWGTKQQLVELREYLEKMWKDADPAAASAAAKDRWAGAAKNAQQRRQISGASAEDAMR